MIINVIIGLIVVTKTAPLPTSKDCVAIKKDILYNKNSILAETTYLRILISKNNLFF